jgi:hypothetical protein
VLRDASADTCNTFDCGRPATRTARWRAQVIERGRGRLRFKGTRPESGRYCDECAEKLWRSGDDVDPPFCSNVTPLRRA